MTATKKRIKNILGHLAEASGLLARDLRSKMVVVTFHRVNNWMCEDDITCTPEKFETFCMFFQKYFKIVPLAEQISRSQGVNAAGGTLSITLDDGYRDNFEVAAPILRKLGLPATFFVATGFIGTDNVPPWDQHLARQPGWMNWDQVRSLRDQDFDIGAHTDGHIDLGAISPDSIRSELLKCRMKLKDELGVLPKLFAYPFGGKNNITNESIELVREAGFECCLGAFGGVNLPEADPFFLNRISVGGWFSTPHQFAFEIVSRRA